MKKNLKIIIGVLILMIVGVVAYMGVQQSFQPLSITDASYNNGKVLIYANTQGANALDITFSPSVLNKFLIDNGVKATKTSRLTAEIIKSEISFNYVTNFDNPLRNVERLGGVKNIAFSNLGECRQKYPETYIAVVEKSGWFSTELGCYKYGIEGYINGFPTGQTKSNNVIRFNLDGTTKDISSDNTQISFNGATITWRGNLVSNTFITNPQYQVYRIGNSIRLVQSGADSKVRTEYNTLESCLYDKATGRLFGTNLKGYEISSYNFNYCSGRYTDEINGILTDKKSEYISHTQGIKSIDAISNGVLKVSLDTPTFIPTFTIELDASKVGIVKLSGDPNIISCPNDVNLKGSGSENTKITIRNDGESEGYFIFQTTTNNNAVSCNILPVSINKGQTKTLDVFYSGSITSKSDVKGTCNIKVYDSNDNSNYDTCSFGINVEYEPFTSECNNEGATKCSADGRSVLTCKGGFWEADLCDYSCIIKDGKAICSGEIPPSMCKWYEDSYTKIEKDYGAFYWRAIVPFIDAKETPVSGCKTSGWVYLLGIGVIVIVLGSVLIFSMKKGDKKK